MCYLSADFIFMLAYIFILNHISVDSIVNKRHTEIRRETEENRENKIKEIVKNDICTSLFSQALATGTTKSGGHPQHNIRPLLPVSSGYGYAFFLAIWKKVSCK